MNAKCQNCQKQDWEEGDDLVLLKLRADKESTGLIRRMIVKSWICQSCKFVMMTFVRGDERGINVSTKDLVEDIESGAG